MSGMPEDLREVFLIRSRHPQHRRRVELAKERVAEWLARSERPYVAFSTGKDSTCVLHLVREQCSDVPAVYFDADCAFPECHVTLKRVSNTIEFKADEPLLDTFARFGSGFIHGGARIERLTMQSTVWGPKKRLVEQYGFDGVAYGLRAEENPSARGKHARVRGANFRYKDGVYACQPIHDWSYWDVWAFIVSREIVYCAAYDRMWDMPEDQQRISYWAGETNVRYGRWSWLRRNYPDLFNGFAERFPEVRGYV